ncbi:hypothetical protein Hesp01_14960 [Herbidospora sp. NBRC 101105]|nr:hypothetical protein Hesp01_14960 [Herbidospora sp. NBRC 101105]
MNDIVQAARREKLTSLLAALHLESALLYIPRHVLIEVERDLAEYALKPRKPVNPESAMKWWRDSYAPYMRVVDVPDDWGADDPRVEAVGNRHDPNAPPEKFSDAPTARLALALAECFVICRDDDLTDYSFGRHEHLELLHAAANEGEKQYVDMMAGLPLIIGGSLAKVGVDGFRRLSPVAQICTAIGAGALAYLWQRNGRARRQIKRVGTEFSGLLQTVGPPLMQIQARLAENQAVWERHSVRRDGPASVSEQAARILAYAPHSGMLAVEIAKELQAPGSLAARTTAVRATLEKSGAFTQVSRGRWQLGEPVIENRPTLKPQLMADWVKRAHEEVALHQSEKKTR